MAESSNRLSKSQNPPRASRLTYLPGLDGLRALAVIAVLLYHAGLGWMSGGFLGVEIFFVISGYLITSMLLSEWEARGRIDLKSFWLRRARRLLPALWLLLSASLAFAIAFLPGEVATLRGDVAAAVTYCTNWYYIYSQKSYFVAVGRPSLFQHLWSLAVEEQFYLIWPPLFFILLTFLKPRGILRLVLLGALASEALMALLYQPTLDPSRVYYGTDTRAGGLLIGAALAFLWSPTRARLSTRRLVPWLLDGGGLIGLGVLLVACMWLNEYQPFLYRGGFAVVALATGLTIAATVHPRAFLGRALGQEPLRWLGLRSYGIYLWHWPVFMVTRPQLDVNLDGLPLLALRVGVTLVLAAISYHFVETPIRQGAIGRAWKAMREANGRYRLSLGLRWAAAVLSLMALSVGLGESVVTAQAPTPPPYLAVTSLDTIGSVENSPPVSAPPVAVSATPRPALGEPASTPTAASAPIMAMPGPDREPTIDDRRLPRQSGQQSSSADAAADAPTPPIPVAETPTTAVTDPSAADSAATPVPPTEPPATPVDVGKVSAFGDSVMLGAATALQQHIQGIGIDAAVGRAFISGIEIVRARHTAGKLGPTVIIHLGDNGPITADQIAIMMSNLTDERRVIFVTDKVPRDWEGPNNQVLAQEVPRYPNAVLLDWHAASVNHPEFFWDDGMHLRPEGAQFYARLITEAVAAP